MCFCVCVCVCAHSKERCNTVSSFPKHENVQQKHPAEKPHLMVSDGSNVGDGQPGSVRYLPSRRELVTGCLQWHPGHLSWNSVLTQVLGSGGRETSKLGREEGEGRRREGRLVGDRERERASKRKWRNRNNVEQLK